MYSEMYCSKLFLGIEEFIKNRVIKTNLKRSETTWIISWHRRGPLGTVLGAPGLIAAGFIGALLAGYFLIQRKLAAAAEMAQNLRMSLGGLVLETVTYPPDGLNITGGGAQLLAQGHNFHVHGPVRHRIVITMNSFDNVSPGQHPARPPGQ